MTRHLLVFATALALAARAAGTETLGVLSVAEPPRASPDLVQLTQAVQAAVADRIRGVVPPEELVRLMRGPESSATLEALEDELSAATAAYHAGEHKSALHALRGVLEDVERLPESPEVFALWSRTVQRFARIEASLGNKEEAAELLSRLVRAHPGVQVDARLYPPSFVRQVDELRAALRAGPHRRLSVTSDRPASIYLDGREVGQTPITLELPPGDYHLSARGGSYRLPPRTVVLEREDRALDLDFRAVATFRPDDGPGLAVPPERHLSAVLEAASVLQLERVLEVAVTAERGRRLALGRLYDVRRRLVLREGRVRLPETGPLAPEATAALAAHLVRGEPSALVAQGTGDVAWPVPRPPPGVVPPEAQAPDVVIHYRRQDGRYQGVRLVTWRSAATAADLRTSEPANVPGERWDAAAPPAGRDDFGVFWRVPTAGFPSGRINFVVRRGPERDECQPGWGPGLAQFWVIGDGREAWVNMPECNTYFTAEQALGIGPGARPAVPVPELLLHYNRPDGRYDRAELVTWPSYAPPLALRTQEPANVPSAPLSRSRPPSGRDAFGAYWRIPADGFANGRVNFLVMNGGDRDECQPSWGPGLAQFWVFADGPEAWLQMPDCTPARAPPRRTPER